MNPGILHIFASCLLNRDKRLSQVNVQTFSIFFIKTPQKIILNYICNDMYTKRAAGSTDVLRITFQINLVVVQVRQKLCLANLNALTNI